MASPTPRRRTTRKAPTTARRPSPKSVTMPEQIPPASTELLDDLIFAALANPSSDEPIYDAICRHRALTSSTS